MQQVTFALTVLQKVKSLLFTAMCFIVKIRSEMIHIQHTRLSVTQSLISPSWRSLSSIRLVFWVCLRCCMSLHAGISQRRMLLLWVCCCSLSAFDSLHVCASWARDVKCLWINWWRLLYSECCFFSPIAENTVVWGSLKSCIQLAHEARNVF